MKMIYPHDLEDAQEGREILTKAGWHPLLKVHNAEHWVKDGNRIIIEWDGNDPVNTDLKSIEYGSFYIIGNEKMVLKN